MRARFPIILLCALLVTGCGDEPEPVTTVVGLEGPPSFKRAREDLQSRTGLTLTARGACALRFRIEFTGEPPEVGKFIPLRRGEAVRIWWSHAVLDESVDSTLPEDMRAEGRTAVRVPMVRMGLEDRTNEMRSRTVWVRPEHLKETTMDLFVSPEPEVIEFGEALELATIVVADVDGADVSLQPRGGRHRLRLEPPELGPNERVHVMRLFLEVHPAGS